MMTGYVRASPPDINYGFGQTVGYLGSQVL